MAADSERFQAGQEVNLSFDKSIISAIGRNSITVMTASAEFTIDPDAVDVRLEPTGVMHNWRRCLQCKHAMDHCWHKDDED